MKNAQSINSNRWNAVGLFYAITLTLTSSMILFLSKMLDVIDPTWALISAVVCAEFDMEQARLRSYCRLYNYRHCFINIRQPVDRHSMVA